MEKQTFDVEMTDFNELEDVTAVRVSTSGNDSVTLSTGRLTFEDDTAPDFDHTKMPRLIYTADSGDSSPDFALEVAATVQSELDTFQKGPNGNDFQTLRDVFAAVTPSNMT